MIDKTLLCFYLNEKTYQKEKSKVPLWEDEVCSKTLGDCNLQDLWWDYLVSFQCYAFGIIKSVFKHCGYFFNIVLLTLIFCIYLCFYLLGKSGWMKYVLKNISSTVDLSSNHGFCKVTNFSFHFQCQYVAMKHPH